MDGVFRQCFICDEFFIPYNKVQKFCSDHCRNLRSSWRLLQQREDEKNSNIIRGDRYKEDLTYILTECPGCKHKFEIIEQYPICECPVCGGCIHEPVEGVDIQPRNVKRFRSVILPPDAFDRFMKLHKAKALSDEPAR